MAFIEGFTFVQGPKSGYPYRDDDYNWKLLLHTTETPAGTAKRLADIHQWPPHFWVDPATGERIQSIDSHQAAYALKNLSGGVETNADRVVQIETVGYTAETPHWSEQRCEWYGRQVIAPILKAHPEIKLVWVGFAAPATGGNWARPDAEIRLQGSEWDLYSGILGHQHAPENDHVDPGAILIDKIMFYALAELNEPTPTPNPPSKPPVTDPLNQIVRVGSPRDLVLPVQTVLVFWGRLPGDGADGVYGAATKEAVRQFQADLNSGGFDAGTDDGVWGPKTYAAYKEWLASNSQKPTPPVTTPPAADILDQVISSETSQPEEIKALQTVLQGEGYYSFKIDGDYGPLTKAGVKKLQANLNAGGHNAGAEDGLWGPKTYAAYKRYKETTPISRPVEPEEVEEKFLHQTGRVLMEGSEGKDVAEIQFLLNVMNSNHPDHFLTPDGIYGPKTEAQVERFQTIYNVFYDPNIDQDGVVGNETRNALARVLNARGIW